MSDEAIELINRAKAEARNESFRNFLKKHGKKMVVFAAISLVALVVVLAFFSYQRSQQAKYSEILHKSLLSQQLGNIEEAKQNLKQIYDAKSVPSGVRSLALLRYAALLLADGNKSDSAKIYLEINSCGSCDEYVKDLAGLLVVRVWVSDETELQKPDLSERIEKIEKSSKFLKHQVSEQRALLELQRNNLEKSYQIFDLIANNPESSQTLKARANDGLKMVISKGYEPKK